MLYRTLIEEAALKEEIFEPKYGGKDHSGYDTMMKYEINGYLSECFEKGAMFWFSFMMGFIEWAFNDSNPFLYDEKTGRYIQSCGNSSSWSYDQLLDMYIEQKIKADAITT